MAIMKNVDIGHGDAPDVALFFNAVTPEGTYAQYLLWGNPLCRETLASVYSIRNLEGAPCLIEVDGMIGTFIKVLKL
jgi:hypothetical protein